MKKIIGFLIGLVLFTAFALAQCPPEYGVNPEVTCPDCNLVTGWNNVIYQGETMSINVSTSSIKNSLDYVYYYDGVDWFSYDPSIQFELNTLRTITKGECYTFNMTEDTHWSAPSRCGVECPPIDPRQLLSSTGVWILCGMSNFFLCHPYILVVMIIIIAVIVFIKSKYEEIRWGI